MSATHVHYPTATVLEHMVRATVGAVAERQRKTLHDLEHHDVIPLLQPVEQVVVQVNQVQVAAGVEHTVLLAHA